MRLGGGMPGLNQGPPPSDAPVVDTAEQVFTLQTFVFFISFVSYYFFFSFLQVYISSLALLKMLKHGRAGVPMEVMGLMLGEFVDDYTVRVIDVFAMPQTGTVNVKIQMRVRRLVKYIYTLPFVFSGCQRRSGRSSVPSKDVGHAETDWSARNGGWLVPFSSRIWLLAVWR